jgi:PleD family two-component response regulator
MLQTTERSETSPSIVPHFLRAIANPPVVAWSPDHATTGAEESAQFAEPAFLLPVSSSRQTHLLIIGKDLGFIAQQLGEARGPTRQVHFAGTGSGGLAQVRTDPPKVVLLDLRLPDESGLEVYQQIRRIDARIPVIFVSDGRMDRRIELVLHYDRFDRPRCCGSTWRCS